MFNDNGPKDGDYAKYVEGLGQSQAMRPANEMANLSTPSSDRSELDVLLDKLKDSKKRPDQQYTTRDDGIDSVPAIHVDAATKKSVSYLIRALVIALIAIFIAAPLLPEPFNAIVRLAAIFYVIYVIRNMRPAIAVLRAKLNELKQQGKR